MQTRYILGDAGFSLVVGYGHDSPTHVQNEAASCPPEPVQCNAVSAELSPNPNPNVIYGALVEGPIYTDTFQVSVSALLSARSLAQCLALPVVRCAWWELCVPCCSRALCDWRPA